MIQAIQSIVNETGRDWYKVTQALADRLIITPKQHREIEAYFFEIEA